MAALFFPPNAGTTVLSVLLTPELPPVHLLSPLIQSKLKPRFSRALTNSVLDDKAIALQGRILVRLRLAGCRGVEDRTILMAHGRPRNVVVCFSSSSFLF